MKIGIFDSGRGGELIAEGLQLLLPDHEYVVVNDRKNVPYGSRSDSEVAKLTEAAIQPLLVAACPIIVIACNTATMAAIEKLRKAHPNTRLVGIEPMVKPASIVSDSHHITVLATPLTLRSSRYQGLINQYARDIQIDQPNAAGWAAAIEADDSESIVLDDVQSSVESGSDTIVLACTHYIAVKERIQREFPRANVLEPTEAIARRITALSAEWAQG